MKTNELRIGNWVFDSDQLEEFTIESDTLFDESDGDCMEKHIKPIPLTEEWLIKFGFRNNYKQIDLLNWGFWCGFHNDGDWVIYQGFHNVKQEMCSIDDVHELQNLYFALTNEELKLEP